MGKRAAVYIDGPNLYHGLLKYRPHLKWLDLFRLAEIMLAELPDEYVVTQVNYYTTRVQGQNRSRRQHLYLRALKARPEVDVHYGAFRMGGEKKTDVNLTSHFVRDACFKRFDVVVIITNDTDFEEAIRVVTEDAQLPVVLLSPAKKKSRRGGPHKELVKFAKFTKRIETKHLRAAQLPRRIPGTNIIRPSEWQ